MTTPVRVLDCFKCGKTLAPAFFKEDHVVNQPYAGTTFISHGHYGSTAFDPTPASSQFLELNICDDCLAANREQVLLGQSRQRYECDYTEWTGPER
jgi:hypothetical protein